MGADKLAGQSVWQDHWFWLKVKQSKKGGNYDKYLPPFLGLNLLFLTGSKPNFYLKNYSVMTSASTLMASKLVVLLF